MTFKEWLRQTKNNPTKTNEIDALVDQAERQREIAEDDANFCKANQFLVREIS